jgi:hypothetical protein
MEKDQKSSEKSWYGRILGRSFLNIIFGNFFEKKSNSAGIIAILLVGTLCFVVIHNLLKNGSIEKELNIIANVVFVVIGYYFGSKQEPVLKDKDE